MVHLEDAINDGPRQGWHTIGQNSCIAPLQQYAESTPEVRNCFSFLLSSMPRQGCPQLPHLLLRCRVPAPEGLCHHGDEGDPLSAAILLSSPDLSVMSKCEVAEGQAAQKPSAEA